MNGSVLTGVLLVTLSAGSGQAAWSQAATATPTPTASHDSSRPTATSASTASDAGLRTLDLEALEDELRNTQAIGLFTKIALKNQISDLLEHFRAHHANGRTAEIAALRPRYDMLVMKVLALIQDSDPALAGTIAASREPIWQILADREQFHAAI